MAAPMRDGPLDGGHRSRAPDARAAPRTDQPNAAPNNFEYDDNEWDIGIGDLIIDLDADIEKTDEGTAAGGAAMASAAGAPGKTAAKMGADHSATLDKGLKMKIKRTKPGTKTSEAKHEIVKTNEVNGAVEVVVEGAAVVPAAGPVPAGAVPARRSSGAHRRDKTTRDKHVPTDQSNGVVVPPVAGAVQPPVVTTPALAVAAVAEPPAQPPVPAAPPMPPIDASPPPAKKPKMDSKVTSTNLSAIRDSVGCSFSELDSADVCVGTSVGTITEPDCLGPCEPGTSVTLEGIVWHETEGGVLVVNVTWRGKTYVGTLLDCTRHDWAPPRFCDSPTEELDARTPKGRGKRGRAAAPGGDLSNFTETRSSVHSKLRNGGAKGRRGGAATGGVTPGPVPAVRDAPSPPPTPKVELPPVAILTPAGKRKSRAPDEDSPVVKRRVPASPPASPALLECPEPNCSKKYKHINGLKYHQSHAHGAIEEDESKDIASMSENDESNAEAPSPAGPVKSPEKLQEPATPKKEERTEVSVPPVIPPRAPSPVPPAVPPPAIIPSQPLPAATPPVAAQPVLPIAAVVDPKPAVVKPGVLRFGPQEDFPVANFANKPPPTITPTPAIAAPVAVVARPPEPPPQQFPLQIPQTHVTPPPVLPPIQHAPPQNPHPIHVPHPPHVNHPVLPPINHVQHPVQPAPLVGSLMPHGVVSPAHQKGLPPSPQNPQFKVKPTAALMPTDDKKLQDARQIPKPQGFKKNKNRKSPGGSPHPPEQVPFGIETSNRDDVQSPAYSDISDDTAPAMDVEPDKIKAPGEKKPDGVPPLPHSIPPTYGMYQFYGQSPYMVNQPVSEPNKLKDDLGKPLDGKAMPEKEIKREGPPESIPPQKMLSQHYYPYGYMPPGYAYNMDPNYGPISLLPEDRMKEQQERERERERSKESPSPAEHSNGKPPVASPQQPQHMHSSKMKPDMLKESKHPNDNHQILKESIEMKSQMHPYLYQRQQQAQQFHQQAHQQAQHHQKEEEMRRYYMSLEQQRRKENSMIQEGGKPPQMQQQQQQPSQPSGKSHSNQGGQPKMSSGKDQKPSDDGPKSSMKEDIKPIIKQEGQKPTMETTGPPPPLTSQYYLHSPFMQQSPYGVPFDPYRQMNLVSGPYVPGPFLHPGPMPRFHAPEDLSRPPPSPKSIDLLQHASQYYSSHKIHELQERALKSPTPKAPPGPGGSPGVAPGGPPGGAPPPPPAKPGNQPSPSSSESPASGKESRSPPPQRHVHTHHHTHVGLGYPLYPAPYGAAVIASQQAAAVTVVNSFPPK